MYSRNRKTLQPEGQTPVLQEENVDFQKQGNDTDMVQASAASAMTTGSYTESMSFESSSAMGTRQNAKAASTMPSGKDPKKKEAKQKKKAKKRIDKGNAIVNAGTDMPGFNREGVVMKLKKRWITDKNWKYYALYLQDWGFDPIASKEDLLKLDSTPDSKWLNVRGSKDPVKNGTIVNEEKLPEQIDETSGMGKEAEANNETIIKEEEIVIEEEDVIEENEAEIIDESNTSTERTVDHILEWREEKTVFEQYPAIEFIDNAGAIGQNIDKTITGLDPSKEYIVWVIGIAVKDKVDLYVDGKRVDGDPKFKNLQRILYIPKGSTNVRIVAQAREGSYISAEFRLDKQKQIVKYKTMRQEVYSDGTTGIPYKVKGSKGSEEPVDISFQKYIGWKNFLSFWEQVGEKKKVE